jgi:hypothetical protein
MRIMATAYFIIFYVLWVVCGMEWDEGVFYVLGLYCNKLSEYKEFTPFLGLAWD